MRTSVLVLLLQPVLGWVPSFVANKQTNTARPRFSSLPSTTTTASAEPTLDGFPIRQEIAAVSNILVVKVKETLTATLGGILLPDQSQERPTEGLVVVAGPGKVHPMTGVRITNPIEAGMSVLYGRFDGTAVEYNGEECQIVKDDNVLLAYNGVTMRLDNVIPIRDYVLIELDDTQGEELSTASGVVIAGQVTQRDLPCEGVVVKVGEGRMCGTGEVMKCPVQPGERVKFKDYAGNEVMIEGKEYTVVKMVDILATYKGSAAPE